jgi:hypothetical protein
MTGRRRRRLKQILDVHKEKSGSWKLEDEALELRIWRTGFGINFRTIRKASYRMNEMTG